LPRPSGRKTKMRFPFFFATAEDGSRPHTSLCPRLNASRVSTSCLSRVTVMNGGDTAPCAASENSHAEKIQVKPRRNVMRKHGVATSAVTSFHLKCFSLGLTLISSAVNFPSFGSERVTRHALRVTNGDTVAFLPITHHPYHFLLGYASRLRRADPTLRDARDHGDDR
jgi:hypothetical protein